MNMVKYRSAATILISAVLCTAGCSKTIGENTSKSKPITEPPKATIASSINDSPKAPIVNTAMVNPTITKDAIVNNVSASGRKVVALTFDDGPDDKYTPRILDILKQYQVKATFFLIGVHAEKYPQVVKRIEEEGHVLGNHTWEHPDLAKLTSDQINSQITRTDDILKEITGVSPVLFRAPYGAVSQDVITDATQSRHQIIGWSVDTMDWDGKTVEQILGAVRKEVRPGAIILQHSAGGKGGNLNNTIEALPQIITYLRQKGYSFLTVPELIASSSH